MYKTFSLLNFTFISLLSSLITFSAWSSTQALPPAGSSFSELWGQDGEKWNPQGRLPDFSYAGYQAGNLSIPDVMAPNSNRKIYNVKALGAKGDGTTDDGSIVRKIIGSIPENMNPTPVLYFPSGKYVLANRLEAYGGRRFIIKGDGPSSTTLYFPKSLRQLEVDYYNSIGQTPPPLIPVGAQGSRFSLSPALITFYGSDPMDASTLLADITQEAKRGSKLISVSAISKFAVGNWIRISQTEVFSGEFKGSLTKHLYGDLPLPTYPSVNKLLAGEAKDAAQYVGKIVAINTALSEIQLDRALPFELKKIWTPRIYKFQPSLKEVGIEGVHIQFPAVQYSGHNNEQGYNGIFFKRLAHSWIRNVQISNADNAINIDSSNFVTATQITVTSNRPNSKLSGHHGFQIGRGGNHLITQFDVRTRFNHDLSVEFFAMNVAYTNGKGTNLNIDLHGAIPYGTLFSNIDLGWGTRAFESSGDPHRGLHSGAFGTFWRVTASGLSNGSGSIGYPVDMKTCSANYGHYLNFIGNQIYGPRTKPSYCRKSGTPDPKLPTHWHVESMDSDIIWPQDIQGAMRDVRVNSGL